MRVANLGLTLIGLLLPAKPVGAPPGPHVLPEVFYDWLGVVLAGYASKLLATRRWDARTAAPERRTAVPAYRAGRPHCGASSRGRQV